MKSCSFRFGGILGAARDCCSIEFQRTDTDAVGSDVT